MLIMLASLASTVATAEQEPQPPADEKKPDDLAARLIRNTVDESNSEDPMVQMMRDMSEVAQKLQVDFDPGEQTQAQQRQVSARLDEAIKAAAARRRAQSQPDSRQMADKRKMSATKKPESQPADRKKAGEGEAKSTAEKSTGEATQAKQAAKADVPSTRRPWGNLPQRDREEVLQGAEEESLEQFRPWIEQYFRALQEPNR
jgi:hypothetical protein